MAGTVSKSPQSYLASLAQLAGAVDASAVQQFSDCLYEAWRNDRTVFVFGNGGSAYTASHHVTDYVKTAGVVGQRRLRAMSLVDNYGLTTAIGNDVAYDQTFSHLLESYSRTGDLAVAISCSGNSPNVVAACDWAKAHGLGVVALTGFTGGKIASIADLHINVPSDNYGLIEDLHLSMGHIVAQLLYQRVLERVGT